MYHAARYGTNAVIPLLEPYGFMENRYNGCTVSETLLKYNENRSRFGKGPKKPQGTGHCYNDACGAGDAVGVRLWWHMNWKTKVTSITNAWWTGQGCDYCMATAAVLAENIIGTKIRFPYGFEGGVFKKILVDLCPNYRDNQCVSVAVEAFERAVEKFDTPTDWMDLDMPENDWASIEDYQE